MVGGDRDAAPGAASGPARGQSCRIRPPRRPSSRWDCRGKASVRQRPRAGYRALPTAHYVLCTVYCVLKSPHDRLHSRSGPTADTAAASAPPLPASSMPPRRGQQTFPPRGPPAGTSVDAAEEDQLSPTTPSRPAVLVPARIVARERGGRPQAIVRVRALVVQENARLDDYLKAVQCQHELAGRLEIGQAARQVPPHLHGEDLPGGHVVAEAETAGDPGFGSGPAAPATPAGG